MSGKKGIKMGVDPVMDKNIYDDPNKRSKEYVTSINPNGDSDDDQDMTQQIETNRQNRSSSNNNNKNLMQVDDESIDFDPMSTKHKQIQSKNNEYQNRQFDRGYTPARADPFQNVVQPNKQSTTTTKPTLSDSRKEIVKDQPRSYRDIMQMRQVEKEQQEARDILSGKRKKFSDQKDDDDD
eukprot:273691_1